MPRPTIEWTGGTDGHARIIDQTKLPLELEMRDIRTVEEMYEAIKVLRIRGAPAIGIAGAYGLAVAAGNSETDEEDTLRKRLEEAAEYLKSSRPTAVNLSWAIDRVLSAVEGVKGAGRLREAVLAEAREIHEEDRRTCRRIGEVGQEVVTDGATILTHCNAGALATADYGTALAVIYRAHELGRRVSVFADETRPLLQGSRLTAWELQDAGIDVTVICDNMAASIMNRGMVDLVITGADRIAANGDAANKIGTLGLAVLARRFDVPFYVAAPISTFDLTLASGEEIPIEEREPEEVTEGFGRRTAPEGVKVCNPAFDVTPAELITGIITERALIHAPDTASVRNVVGSS